MKLHLKCLAILILGFSLGIYFHMSIIFGITGSLIGVIYGSALSKVIIKAAKYAALHPYIPKSKVRH